MAAEPKYFVDLFNKPSVDAMHALSPQEFERFVAYVLRRAGYDVREVGPHWLRGVDLEVRLPGKSRIFGGIECKRYAPDNLVSASVVQHVRGASSVSRSGTKLFVITTSDFKDTAHDMAESGSRPVYLVNGYQLVRYITYIQGSRNDDDDVIASLSPEFFSGRDKTPAHNAQGATILTIANNKGGVGKTTTAYYLGVEFARQGKRVLLIDFDGQGNLTERCIPKHLAALSDQSNQLTSIAQYFAGERPLTNLIIPSETQGVSLIPSDPFLTLRDLGGSGRPDIESRVMRDVQALRSKPIASLGGVPDWIILDTPPAMSVFTRAGLSAADYVLAPVRPRPASLSGTRNMLLTLRTMDALTGTNGRFLGTALTHWDTLELTRRFAEINLPQALQGYLQEYGGHVFQSKIPVDNQLETLEPGAKTGGAKAYAELADEIAHLIESKRQN
jgi:chromosome partitioning protein